MAGGFRQLDERLIHDGHIMRLVEGTFEAPDGRQFTREIIRHPGAVGVVPLVGEEQIETASVLMVRQYRPVLDTELLEIPAGTRDATDRDPAATASRELAEEVGAVAEHLEHLTTYAVAPGVSDERIDLFVATGLTLGATWADGPEEAHMTIERVRLVDAPTLIAGEVIVDAKSIVGLLLALRRFTA
jgi:8-oxo-dGTP pyrophosphatase MutT (NUDIX family)